MDQESTEKITYRNLCEIEDVLYESLQQERFRSSNRKKRRAYIERVLDLVSDLKTLHHTDELSQWDRDNYKIAKIDSINA